MNSLLTASQRARLTVVLVSPRNPLNIGAAARAMANFGFAQLTVVAPYEEHWREAKSAVGASDLLQDARCTRRLAEAVADCTFVVGTAALTRRKPEQPAVSLPDLPPIVQSELARGGRVALVFGSEKRGLTREDLSLCHLLVETPTDPRQPSMNLGQAVAVCLYEISSRLNAPVTPAAVLSQSTQGTSPALLAAHLDLHEAKPSASARELELLAGVAEETMRAANYSPSAMRDANRHDLQLLLRRLALSRHDARRILGLFRRILWSLQHRPGQTRS